MRYRKLLPILTRFNYHLFGRHKLHANPADLSCQPFFILGSGRNGSTLLSMILNGHSKIFIPNEQFALHYAAIRFQLYNFLIWRDLVKLVIGEFADNNNNQAWNTNFNALYGRLYYLPKKEQSFQKIVDEIIKEVSKQNGESFGVWGDKSLPTTWFLKYVHRVYPHSKYVFLIKDGKDVAYSFNKAGERAFQELSKIENAAQHWQNCIDKWQWLKKKVAPHQLLEVKYEDLVTKPEFKIKEILHFLDMQYEEGMLDFQSIVKDRNLFDPVHQSLAKSINTNSIGAWKENLTEAQLLKVIPIMKKGLQEYGYL